MNCGCGKGKLSCKNGWIEAIERDNAQNLPASAFDRHNAEILQSVEATRYGLELYQSGNYEQSELLFIFCSDELKLSRFRHLYAVLHHKTKRNFSLSLLSKGKGSLDWRRT